MRARTDRGAAAHRVHGSTAVTKESSRAWNARRRGSELDASPAARVCGAREDVQKE